MKKPKKGAQAADMDVSTLAEMLGSHDPAERERAREALVAAGHAAVIPLLLKLKSPNNQVCWQAAKILSEIADPAAANALVETLDHDSADVRWVAAEALIALGPEGLKQTLIALLTKSDSICFRDGAHHVLSHFAERRSGQFLLPLLARFDSFEPAVTIPPVALETLHELQQRAPLATKKL